MFFKQIVRQDIGCASYIVGSNDAGEAAVVDPRIDMVDEILATLEQEGLRLRYILETHNHADHVSGHHQLVAQTGAQIAVHEMADAEYPHLALRDGDELSLGEVRLRVIHTPGHRPEHIAVAVIDGSRGDEPWMVLTGDSLFIGDVARPDLAVDARDGARALFTSLHERLMTLPEGTLAYPGHVAGSLCGRVSNRMTGTTVGFECRHNPALAIDDEPEFVRYMTESLPQRPPNMARIVELNRTTHVVRQPGPRQLTAAEALQAQRAGAVLLDVRTPDEFAAGHLPGALSVDLHGGQFPNRVGLAVPLTNELIVVASSAEQAAEAAASLAVIGVEQIGGFLAGIPRGVTTVQLPQLTVDELVSRLDTDEAFTLLDVRERSEWLDGHIPGVENVPFYRVREAAPQLSRDVPVVFICGGGTRSVIAASLLESEGFRVENVIGGMDAWNSAGLPVSREVALAAAS